MSNDKESLFAPTTAELGRLRAEVRAAVAVRWQLARLELSVALGDVKRLAVALAFAGLLTVVSLPVLVVAAADALEGQWGLSRVGWLLVWFAGLVLSGAASAWFGWRRFQRNFVGLEETLEVLREDQAWIDSLLAKKE